MLLSMKKNFIVKMLEKEILFHKNVAMDCFEVQNSKYKKYCFMEEENYVNEYEGIVGGSKRK